MTDNYKEAKALFEGRRVIKDVSPYADHCELFLGLIEPEYCAEIQAALVTSTLNQEQKASFTVEKSNIKFLWQTTDDQQDRIDGEKVPNQFAIRTCYGPLEDHYKLLINLNARGASPCVAINKFSGSKRVVADIVACRAVWVEDDEVQLKGPRSVKDFPLPYSFVVETSSKKYHYYWLTYTEDTKTWERLQTQIMVNSYGSDCGANGLNRAMRIPGFWHKKTRQFPCKIAYILDKDNIPVTPEPSSDFMKIAVPAGGKVEYAFNVGDCYKAKRYDWEDIIEAFAVTTPLASDSALAFTIFDPIETMQKVFNSEDFHGSLTALCMHFANYQANTEYVTNVVQSIMCRVPEAERDVRWMSRFNDVERSAHAAVKKRVEELTNESYSPAPEGGPKPDDEDISFHANEWVLAFPDIAGACTPLDMLMTEFDTVITKPIKSFNFATILSLFSACLQNIPVMPVLGERKANGCHLLLAASTSGKDINISGPLRALARALLQGGYISPTDLRSSTILSSFAFMNSEITSLAAFHKWASAETRANGAVWSNTECTSIINKMSDENSNVSNLSEIIINIQDGLPIPAVHKATNKDEASSSTSLIESYSVLFATQPASVQKYMNAKLLYKGIIGRFDYYIPSHAVQETYESSLSSNSIKPYLFSKETLQFIGYLLTVCSAHITSTTSSLQDGSSRDVVVKYDETDPNIRAHDYDRTQVVQEGPNRKRHVNWDLTEGRKYRSDDQEFNIFINRVPMSSERYLTILTTIQHIYNCYRARLNPFMEAPVATPELVDCACKLGDYQFKVRASRVWTLISRHKGLDDKHQAMLDAIKEADRTPERWQKYLSALTGDAQRHVYEHEKFITISSVTRCLTRDANISTKDGIQICKALADYGYIEFVQLKRIDVRVYDKPIKNVVRLTAQGRGK